MAIADPEALPPLALSMMQPYAWLFAHGWLSIDDRNWSTAYRGALGLHASLGFDERYFAFLQARLQRARRALLPARGQFEHGALIGVADLVDCLAPTAHGAAGPAFDPRRSHGGAAGYFGLVLSRARPRPALACRGRPRLFVPMPSMTGRHGAAEQYRLI